MKIALVGATGMVGREMLKVLEERKIAVDELIPVGTERSIGKEVRLNDKTFKVVSIEDAIAAQPQIALFSAGGGTSLEYAPKFAAAGATVIDNSSAWRMDPDKKLIVPEINANELTPQDKIIANPNCSTIQMVMAMAPLHKKYGIKRLVISTYQSVSGTGKAAVEQMEAEAKGEKATMVYPYPIYKNALPHCDVFEEADYTKEEWKLVRETRKILSDDSLQITATAIRVPVDGGHSESINAEFKHDFDLADVRKILNDTSGVVVQDSPETNTYPMPLYAKGKDEVFVGRIRRDLSQPNTLNLWVVADNLRKGAATNAVQIAEYIISKGLI